MRDPSPEQCLEPSPSVDSAHPAVVAFARDRSAGARSDVDRAVALYYAVRDEVRYDPYDVEMSIEGLRASATLARGRGWCVPKAALLAAACRALGIPARLGFADVRNHLSTARLRERMGTDVFYWHGFTSVHLEGRWVKATPAFNAELCRKLGIATLEFDGRSDSLYHPFDLRGERHMEYLRQRGEYLDVPLDAMNATFRRVYGGAGGMLDRDADFDADVEAEADASAAGPAAPRAAADGPPGGSSAIPAVERGSR